ncbi:hypothetical protein AB0J72_51045 [Dactylosporangium sp. NPDC049742]|uniref:hypothetical protein n=1 Tax=Dactylosporangium sp. NPDC049742 TaxID=3154737 RepID=UPI003435FEDF
MTAPNLTDPPVPGALPRWLERLMGAKEAAAFGDQEALRWFVQGMIELEPSGHVQLICQLLDFNRPQAGWKHLDRHVRQRFAWHAAAMDVVGGRLVDGSAGPVSWVLAGMHPDGRVRQRAIDAMCAGPLAVTGPADGLASGVGASDHLATKGWVSMWDFLEPDTHTGPLTILMPVIMLRSADWVDEVRAAALAALRVRVLADARFLPTAVWSLPLVAGRTRGRQAVAVLREAFAVAPANLRDTLVRAVDPAIGRTSAALCRDLG